MKDGHVVQPYPYRIFGSDEFERLVRRSTDTRSEWLRAEREFYTVAARTVEGVARNRARVVGGVAAKSAADIRTAGPATVVYGGQGYSMGAEFGSYRYKQFNIWRGNADDAGYFLWPSIQLFRDKQFVDAWSRNVWRVISTNYVKK